MANDVAGPSEVKKHHNGKQQMCECFYKSVASKQFYINWLKCAGQNTEGKP
jgi:hypothetical protein